jgi:hypothetical protein
MTSALAVLRLRVSLAASWSLSFAWLDYRALGYRKSVGNAVAQANAALTAKQLIDEHRPVCRTRAGISADHFHSAKSRVTSSRRDPP